MSNESVQQLVSVMQDWIPKDASIAIAIDNYYLHYISGLHDIQIKEGQSVVKGSIAESVVQKGSRVEMLMDDSIFGVSYYGIGYPIELNEKKGAFVVILPTTYHFLKKEPLTFLTGKINNSWCPVPIEQVAYIESQQKKTWFYAEDKMYSIIYTLKELSHLLPSNFIRIHRSYIVNIQSIVDISRDLSSMIQLSLKDGTVLPVSQTYTNQVRTRLGF